ncbi:hypothetical protein [uncultured Proteiniphilum sp.]|jgi:heparin/heparan-sulfate lyase|uniref:hypothetical protein n=1 Tax=uncultured Proteiniphilum sp. TaxID=497637 RepID=UPI002631A7F7|nr:hypothetical protein [uncultured Proteiniphilum sp.]
MIQLWNKKNINWILLMKTKILLYLFFFTVSIFNILADKSKKSSDNILKENVSIRLETESSVINSEYVEIIEDSRMSGNKGVSLRKKAKTAIDGEREEADITFNLSLPEGSYVISTYAVTDDEGAILMKKATSKYESLYVRIQINSNRPTKRVVYVPWDARKQVSGRFDFNGKNQKLKIWLPKGVRLDYIEIDSYVAPKVPEALSTYNPPFNPPFDRPRLWVNKSSLKVVKDRLSVGENKQYWEDLMKRAVIPFEVQYEDGVEVSYDAKLENAAREKAFYYLMTNEEKIGKEAIQLMTSYLSHVEFGNLLDITREIGRAIYTASLVYDWCYRLMEPEDKDIIYENLMRLAEEMEIGWPPFKQSVLTGHGSEAQITRDLLSMSIAIYDENPQPYNYCSYRILEELVPMRNWQYQSPRHNQGVSYAAFRSTWDMHAAWLLKRMSGKEVFDENIKKLPLHWLYLRLPDGQMLRDGDGIVQGNPGEPYYWKSPLIMFLFYTYASDPIVKGEFERQGGEMGDSVLFLLLNDPNLKANQSLNSLPLTIDFGPIMGSMVARTGWNIGPDSDDVVAEVKGGGYHFGNHQHSDAGALQIYYRGIQVADLGIYGFYGPPYDFNFHKRSISHSMMLAVDPNEKFGNTESNDGGTKFNQRHPETIQKAQSDPWFNNGTILSADFGPSQTMPTYSYFSVNLKGAYSPKIEDYIRQFCFVNLENDSIPAIIVLFDRMITSDPNFKKYWQVNTLNHPVIQNNHIALENRVEDRIGKTHIKILVPEIKDYTTTVLSGDDANSSFAYKYEVPGRIIERNFPEAKGHRIMLSPAEPSKEDSFLTFFQLSAEHISPIEVKHRENEHFHELSFADYIICMNKELDLISDKFTLKLPSNSSSSKIILTGLKEGKWIVKRNDGKIIFDVDVLPNKNTIYFQSPEGVYDIIPGR